MSHLVPLCKGGHFMSIVDEHEFINEYFNAISKSLNTSSDK